MGSIDGSIDRPQGGGERTPRKVKTELPLHSVRISYYYRGQEIFPELFLFCHCPGRQYMTIAGII